MFIFEIYDICLVATLCLWVWKSVGATEDLSARWLTTGLWLCMGTDIQSKGCDWSLPPSILWFSLIRRLRYVMGHLLRNIISTRKLWYEMTELYWAKLLRMIFRYARSYNYSWYDFSRTLYDTLFLRCMRFYDIFTCYSRYIHVESLDSLDLIVVGTDEVETADGDQWAILGQQ